MKKILSEISYWLTTITFTVLMILVSSCKETPCDVQEDINLLKQYRAELQKNVELLGELKKINSDSILVQENKLKELNIYTSGRTPQYILKLQLKQSHFTLDLEKHMKDAMNKIQFEMPVDKAFYEEVSVGTQIIDDFRSGSFWLEGSIGNWEMTVINKEIR